MLQIWIIWKKCQIITKHNTARTVSAIRFRQYKDTSIEIVMIKIRGSGCRLNFMGIPIPRKTVSLLRRGSALWQWCCYCDYMCHAVLIVAIYKYSQTVLTTGHFADNIRKSARPSKKICIVLDALCTGEDIPWLAITSVFVRLQKQRNMIWLKNYAHIIYSSFRITSLALELYGPGSGKESPQT